MLIDSQLITKTNVQNHHYHFQPLKTFGSKQIVVILFDFVIFALQITNARALPHNLSRSVF
jgi:hypothetical protein